MHSLLTGAVKLDPARPTLGTEAPDNSAWFCWLFEKCPQMYESLTLNCWNSPLNSITLNGPEQLSHKLPKRFMGKEYNPLHFSVITRSLSWGFERTNFVYRHRKIQMHVFIFSVFVHFTVPLLFYCVWPACFALHVISLFISKPLEAPTNGLSEIAFSHMRFHNNCAN